jgi:hypothetical protein
MAKRRWTGLWLVAGTLFAMQTGGRAESHGAIAGPSQGAIPAAFMLADSGARGPSPEAGTGGVSQDGGSRPAPVGRRNSPIDARPRDTSVNPSPPAGGGGGGGTARRSAVVPVLRGNPDGVDAVQDATPSPSELGGGGGGGVPADLSPFIRVLPGGNAADWTRSPSPGTR